MFKDWDKVISGCLQGDNKDVATLACIPAIFSNLLTALLIFSGITALAMFVMGSLKYMYSGGDPKKLEGANNNFKFAIIGFIIVACSFLIINLISLVTGVECIKTFGFGCLQAP